MLMLYTIVVFAIGAAAEQALHGERPLAVIAVALAIVLTVLFAARRLSAIVQREGRWQKSVGPFRLTLQSRVPPAPQAHRPCAPRRRRRRSCFR